MKNKTLEAFVKARFLFTAILNVLDISFILFLIVFLYGRSI